MPSLALDAGISFIIKRKPMKNPSNEIIVLKF
jgi:hypothetical protein